MAHATVSRCLVRRGMSRRPRSPREAVRRFEWPCPGDLLQMDTKRLARFTRPGHAVTGDRHRTAAEKRQRVGWEFCHSMIDDHSRLAYTEIHRDEKAPTVVAFVERALEFFAAHGITARRLQTDNALELRPQPRPRATSCRARDPSPHDPAAHAQAQRQGRALPADPRPRMGLRTALSRLTRPRGSAADLARALQLHPQPQLALQPAAHHPRSGPAEAQQLAVDGAEQLLQVRDDGRAPPFARSRRVAGRARDRDRASAPRPRGGRRPFGSTSTTTPRSGVTPIDSKACSTASAERGPVQIDVEPVADAGDLERPLGALPE